MVHQELIKPTLSNTALWGKQHWAAEPGQHPDGPLSGRAELSVSRRQQSFDPIRMLHKAMTQRCAAGEPDRL